MAPISGNIPIKNFDWNVLADKINDLSPSAKINSATFDEKTGNLTFVTGKDENIKEITISVPDIDSPGEIDKTEFASLVAKLGSGDTFGLTQGQIEQLKEVFSKMEIPAMPKQTGSILFDLYALMALMLEVSQKQRDAAREIRQTENLAVQQSIQNQADEQRHAALTGLCAGLAASAIQLGLTTYSSLKQVSASKTQVDILKNSGIAQAEKNVTTTKSEFNKQNDIANQMDELNTAKNNLNEADVKLDAAQKKVSLAKIKVENLKAELGSLKDVKNLSKANKEAYPKELETKISAAEKELNTARADYESAADNRVKASDAYDAANKTYTEYSAKNPDLKLPEGKNVNNDSVKIQKARAQDAKTNYEHAQNEYADIQNKINTNVDYKDAGQRHDKWQTYGALFNTIGGLLTNIAQTWQATLNAEATRAGAEQTRAQEQLDQIKDLFAQAQEVINKVISLFEAVIQAENASMRDTIQA